MSFDTNDNKWKPITVQNETLSYLRIIQTADNISISPVTNSGFFKYAIFNQALANHSVVLVGTDMTILNNYTLQINTTGAYEFGISATSEQGNMNFTLV
jgi:hypothetical protein